MTDYVYPQRTAEQPERTASPDRWYSPLELRPWVVRAMGCRPKRRKGSRHSHKAPPDKWYSPLELRPWVVRAMGYWPKTRKDSGHPHISPFRQYIEEIVAAKIAEHLGAETATSSSMAAKIAAREISATDGSTTEDNSAASNLVRGLEETLATLGQAEEGSSRQHDSASTGTAQAALSAAEHILGAQNSPRSQSPEPRNPRSPRRGHRTRLVGSLINFLMPDLAKLDPARRPASASSSAFASESIARQRQGYGARSRSDTRPYRKNMWPWRSKRKNRDNTHKGKQKKGKNVSKLDRAETNRRNSTRNEDRLAEEEEGEGEGEGEDEVSDDEISTSEQSATSISAQVGRKRNDAGDSRLAQDDQYQIARRSEEMNFHGSSGGGGNRERKMELSRARDRSRSRSRSRGRSWSRGSKRWNFHQ